MFGERGNDRRQSYSFKQHLHRALATKGLRRLLAPMVGTAIVAGVAFAYCGSEGITGPSSASSAPASAAPGKPLTSAMVTKIPVDFTEFPVQFTSASTCRQDLLQTTKSRLNGTGTLTLDGSTGFHAQVHLNYAFQAVGTTLSPRRTYSGSQDYDHEMNFAGGTVDRFDIEMHVIARGEDPNALFPDDDFIMHVNVEMQANQPAGLPPTLVPVKANAFAKCQ